MFYQRITLSEIYPCLGDSKAYLDIMLYEVNDEYGVNYLRPAMIVVPGGGYEFVSYREKEPVAFKFLSEGFNAFVLTYSVHKPYPIPQLELACAFDYINKHKEEFHLTGEVLLSGFSAGGHLVASYGLKYKELENKYDFINLRPSCIFMAYPVINLVKRTHGSTSDVISNKDDKMRDELSVDLYLDETYPPTYVWTTDKDSCVPMDNTTRLVDALKKHNVKCGYDIFHNKDHGYSIATRETRVGNFSSLDEDEKEIYSWVSRAIDFYTNEVRGK